MNRPIRATSIRLLSILALLLAAAAPPAGSGAGGGAGGAGGGAAEVKVYAFHAGSLKTQTQYLLKDTRPGTPLEFPIVFFVVRHGSDWVAFDTGCNAKAATDAAGYWGDAIVKHFAPVIEPGQEFKRAIRSRLGLTPADFKAAIVSHGHLDHAGAIEDFRGTRVPIYFQKAELAEIRRAVAAPQPGSAYVPADLEHLGELNVREIDGPLDVFGDRSVIVFPTPGHTPGHQSLYVRLAAGRSMIYCADALYTLESMEKRIPPAIAADVSAVMQNFYWFQLQQWTGTTIVPSHDPDYWANRAWAPKELVP